MSRILGQPVHVCYVYPDFDAALERFAQGGIGPFFVMHSGDSSGRYRGQDLPLNISVAFFYTGDMCIEVITLNGPQTNAYSEFIERNPTGGLHHMAYMSDDFDATLAKMAAAGRPLRVVQEYFNEGDAEPFEIYCEPEGEADPIMYQLMRPGLFDAWFDAMKAAADNWDGSEPIRDAYALMMEARTAAAAG